MPENDEQDLSARAQAPAETALEKYEREQLTRRQALRKFGITSAMATVALFSVDDLARMVGKAMQQRAGDNKVVAQLAKEFQEAGLASAGRIMPLNAYGCNAKTTQDACTKCCQNACNGQWGCTNQCEKDANCQGKPAG